jgi:hypothetical protein
LTSVNLIAARPCCRTPLFCARAAIMLGVILATAPTSAFAQVQVHGTPEAVSIEANNTSIEDVLATLGTAFDVHYRSSVNLEKRLNGTYEGSLPKVMRRILNGYSFVVKTGDGGIEVTVIGTSDASLATGTLPSLQLVGQPAQVVPTRVSPAIGVSGQSPDADPPQPSPAVAVVEPSAPKASTPTNTFRRHRRNHRFADSGQGSRPSPPRRTKMAGGTSRKNRSHVWRTRLVQRYAGRADPFGLMMGIPDASRCWLPLRVSCCVCCARHLHASRFATSSRVSSRALKVGGQSK